MKMKLIILFCLSLLSLMPINGMNEDSRPNIIIFLVDDMGVMDTSVPFVVDENKNPMKYPLNNWYRTPNMESLSETGIRFSTFYANNVGTPSRVSLMTGKSPLSHGVTNTIDPNAKGVSPSDPQKWNWSGISETDITLPKLLKEAGYKTIHVGKANFGPKESYAEDPKNLGFDISIGGSSIEYPGSYHGEWGYGYYRGDNTRIVPDMENYYGKMTSLTEALTQRAKIEIDKSIIEGKPFFLNLSHYAAHSPVEEEKNFIGNYSNSDKTEEAKKFASLIEGVDRSLGEILSYLKSKGVAENTIILFMSDNGSDADMGEMNGINTTAPYRGKKGTYWEGGIRVPFIASWVQPANNDIQKKWKIPSGSIQQQMGTINDIFPTILSLAGINPPKNLELDGMDLHKQIIGKKNGRGRDKYIVHYPHQNRKSHFTIYIEGEWKLIYEYNPKRLNSSRPILLNRELDIPEEMNFATIEIIILESMINKMKSELERKGAYYPLGSDGKPIIPRAR